MFSHEKLSVYQKALICVSSLIGLSRSWDKRHAHQRDQGIELLGRIAQMLHVMADG